MRHTSKLLIALLALASLSTACGAEPDAPSSVGAVSILGTWRRPSTSLNERDITYVFAGDAASGTFTYTNINLGGSDGCAIEATWMGRWTLAGASLTLASTSGTSVVRGCTDPRHDEARAPLPPMTLQGLDGTTSITLTATTLTIASRDDKPALTYTRR